MEVLGPKSCGLGIKLLVIALWTTIVVALICANALACWLSYRIITEN